jgi:hypothetical protein
MTIYSKEYYQRNKVSISKNQKEYRQKNKEHIKEHVREYYQKNKDIYQKANKTYRQNNPWVKHLNSAKKRCRIRNSYLKRGIKCLLTVPQIKKLWFRDKAHELKQPSLDRKEGNLNYTLENCRFIEHLSNCSRPRTFVCPKCGHAYQA